MPVNNTAHLIRDVLVAPATYCLIVSEQLLNGQLGEIEGEAQEIVQTIHSSALEQFARLNLAWSIFDDAEYRTLRQMAHDMLTPLANIITHCDYGLHILDVLTDVQSQRLYAIMYKMYHLKRQLLNLTDYARFQTATGRPITPMNPHPYLNINRDEFLSKAKMRVQIDKDLPQIYANPLYLSRSLMNLVDNALRHTQEGVVDIQTHITATKLHIIVSDTGEGMERMDIRSSYAPFQPIDVTTHRLGLGLHLVNRSVAVQGGLLDIQSQSNYGTTVTMALRRVED